MHGPVLTHPYRSKVDGRGALHVAYASRNFDPGKGPSRPVIYATNANGEWNFETLYDAPTVWDEVDIAAGSEGTIHAVWRAVGYGDENDAVFYGGSLHAAPMGLRDC
ncbi:MAG: hypothetical protein M5R36_12300 [Deltaproteobacteria bacterium]|nr:hypothetical protein [Deltaproteobacteria bacterium]